MRFSEDLHARRKTCTGFWGRTRKHESSLAALKKHVLEWRAEAKISCYSGYSLTATIKSVEFTEDAFLQDRNHLLPLNGKTETCLKWDTSRQRSTSRLRSVRRNARLSQQCVNACDNGVKARTSALMRNRSGGEMNSVWSDVRSFLITPQNTFNPEMNSL